MALNTNNEEDQVQNRGPGNSSSPECNIVSKASDQTNAASSVEAANPPPSKSSGNLSFTSMLSLFTASSISTFIQCELPMVDKRLTPTDRDDLINFINNHIVVHSRGEDTLASGEMNFLSTNPMSVAKKLFLDKMETLYDGPVPAVEYAPFSYPIGLMKMAKDFDQLVSEREEDKAAKVKAEEEAARKREEERKLGGIGMVDGKPVFGPVTPWDGKEERDDVPYAQPLYVSKAAIEGMMGSRKQFA